MSSPTARDAGPREVALALLRRIRRERAYANLVLAHAKELSALEPRDRALATMLVYGTLAMEGSLDWALAHVSSRGEVKVPPAVLDTLRLGAYQLLFTDVPAHAAVGETVEAMGVRPQGKWRGLVNGMLRELAREQGGFPWVERGADPPRWLALEYGHPVWLVERLVTTYGPEGTEPLLRGDNAPAPTHVRVNTLKTTAEDLLALLTERGYKAETSGLFSEGLVVQSPPGVWREPEAGSLFLVQDLGSLLAPRMLDPKPRERVLDMACGRGGKTTHLAAIMRDEGEIAALDNVEAKVRQCAELAQAMGATIIDARQADARTWGEGTGVAADGFDAVLLDAPCSGTGTLRRRAELRWRLTPEDIERIKALQAELLAAAARHVRPGGRIVYATCSILPEENEGQVGRFLASGAGAGFTSVGSRQLLPHVDATDGHFAALLARGV